MNYELKIQCPYKPGSVQTEICVCHLSTTHVTIRLQHSTLRRISHRSAELGRATLRQRFTRTCSPQLAQPVDHPTTGGLLHHLLTLTPDGISALTGVRTWAVIFFCLHLLSPIASIFGSGAPCAARTFLSCHEGTSDRPGHWISIIFYNPASNNWLQILFMPLIDG